MDRAQASILGGDRVARGGRVQVDDGPGELGLGGLGRLDPPSAESSVVVVEVVPPMASVAGAA